MMDMALEIDAVLLDWMTRGTVFYLVVRVIIGSILYTKHRSLVRSQYERNGRTCFFQAARAPS